ncbi:MULTISPECIES: P-loop NTPase fold protein [unclassified Bradyrhizobium]|uniref:P-loop NTPase fold protein n=1 Tax=unclassified Bradyrhizobium TaxID=2631580 RepID=UPI0028EE46F9|nr:MULTISPECIES: P-loop NTPase fold protein [unclassified Bradyrhizobium]
MSVKLVKEEIARFLARNVPEVLCVRGKWGVGKTFAWATGLEAAHKENSIPLLRYSYVSLFGVNSLDELKFAIFENVITLSNGVVKANLDTLDAFVNSKIGSWRKLAKLAQSVPVVRNLIGGDATSLVSFMTIRDQIVCIDDLERRGQKLDISDVLGLISYLREQRNCKIVLILNDEKLDDKAKQAFGANLEKVVDISLLYRPSSTEAVGIAVRETDDASKLIAEKCIALGITNIRVIRRIERSVRAIEPMLSEFDPEVLQTVIGSIALFCWSHDQPEEAPPMEYLESKTQEMFGLEKREDMSAAEAGWSALLESYGYSWTDELDVELIRGIRDGYFDPEQIKKKAKVLHEKVVATKADGSFESAWRRYHDSFAGDQVQVLDEIHASFMKNIQYITPLNLSGTVSLFKELGRPEQAKEMLDHYMAERNEDRAFFDLDDDPFGGNIQDPDIRAAFKEKFDRLEERRDIPAMLRGSDWDQETIAALATLPVEEYLKAFKASSGAELRKMLSNAFQFDRIVNASDAMREIASRARQALQQIGAESAINARRVSRYGVKVDASTSPTAPTGGKDA